MSELLKKFQYNLLKQWGALQAAKPVAPAAPVVVACVFKNEAPFLKEWIDFHLQQGVHRFYLSDNGSTDRGKEVLEPYVKAGRVKVFKTPFGQWSIRRQAQEFNRLIQYIKNEEGSQCWAAFIDVDEYLFDVKGRSWAEVLKYFDHKKVAAVQVNWLMFGTSGIKELDASKPMIAQLTRRAPVEHDENANFKPLAYLANIQGFFEGPHLPIAKGDAQFYFSDGAAFTADKEQRRHSPLRINHYWYRAEADYYIEKKRKREAYGDFRKKELEDWHMKRCNEVVDTEILKINK